MTADVEGFLWGMNSNELNELEKIVENNINLIMEAWNGYFA